MDGLLDDTKAGQIHTSRFDPDYSTEQDQVWLDTAAELRNRKPSPLKRRCGQRQDPECVAEWHAAMKEWNAAYRYANKMWKSAREGPKLSLVKGEGRTKVPRALGFAIGGAIAGGIIYLLTRGPKRVSGREYLEGVQPALIDLLNDWDREGWFDVTVAPPMRLPSGRLLSGGLRTDDAAQAEAARVGLSKATNLHITPHGRGAAIDVYPVGFNPYSDFSTQPEMAGLMAQFASWASQKSYRGFTFYPGINFGDYPHIEIKEWRSLPDPGAVA